MDAVKFLVNKLTACKYFDFTYDAGEALKITQRVKNVIVEPDDYIFRSDVTDGNYWLLDLHWICDVAWSDNESAIIVCTDGMMYDIQLYY